MKLNLEAKNKEQELIKAYLEENASETLAEKINNGTPFEKDGKTFINKKTLDGFIKYATSEARKLASKGANSACIEGEIICGWAIHYFEEQSLEGTLYNLDGTEYKPENKPTKPAEVNTITIPEKPKPKPQMSLFDLLQEQPSTATDEKPTINESVSENIDDKDDEPTEEEIREVMKEIAEEEKQQTIQPVGSPLYQNYIQLQQQYSDCILAYRLICIIAKSPADLIREGEMLHHCVGRMNYDQRFVREESLIFFIRNKYEPEIPFVTVEYSLSQKKILQCYGEHDHKPSEDVLHYVNKIWLPYANKTLKQIAA